MTFAVIIKLECTFDFIASDLQVQVSCEVDLCYHTKSTIVKKLWCNE